MRILITGRSASTRVAVASGLAQGPDWHHAHVSDELRGEGAPIDQLKADILQRAERTAHMAYACPPLDVRDGRRFQRELKLHLVRLKEPGEEYPPIGGALDLDASMPVATIVATIRAVLRIS